MFEISREITIAFTPVLYVNPSHLGTPVHIDVVQDSLPWDFWVNKEMFNYPPYLISGRVELSKMEDLLFSLLQK